MFFYEGNRKASKKKNIYMLWESPIWRYIIGVGVVRYIIEIKCGCSHQ